MVVKGDFLEGINDPMGVVAAPTNGVITPGGLVMGAGAALALARRVPGLREALAEQIKRKGLIKSGFREYGFITVLYKNRLWGAFQTKRSFRQKSDLELIRFSAKQLRVWLLENPEHTVHLAFPGIGLGGLKPEDVLQVFQEILGPSPKRVKLYQL
jgi:hypothetical protein